MEKILWAFIIYQNKNAILHMSMSLVKCSHTYPAKNFKLVCCSFNLEKDGYGGSMLLLTYLVRD